MGGSYFFERSQMEETNKNTGRIFGYARVSTREQNLDRQLIELRKYVPKENILLLSFFRKKYLDEQIQDSDYIDYITSIF